ncbi:MAG TPA: hypothetical protein PKY35_04225 [Candidatus Hydrogenedentes bacterium]|nr:hypothetical protein [Candidatus Hydrogenedentota bacterium]HOL76213.1 hypothetical protein [Candidatus Hydrogenedentota bacterium]HPO86499.1 hypothetical protein [Candidatus Hydrogenedentota bacterium]
MGSSLFTGGGSGAVPLSWNALFPLFNRTKAPSGEAPAIPQEPDANPPVPTLTGLQDTFGRGEDVTASYDALFYTSKFQQVSLSLSAAGQSASGQTANAGDVSVDPAQILFQFYGEARSEQLALFQSRTSGTADKLSGATRESYLEMSRRVGIRFSLSVEISGAALNGFAKTSDALATSAEDVFKKFLSFAKDALGKDDELFNMLFELLDGFFTKAGNAEELFNSFLNQLQGGDNGAQPGTPAFPRILGAQAEAQSFRFQLEFEFTYEEVAVAATQEQIKQSDPITLDLNGNGIQLTSYKEGARFDITGTGTPVTTAFVTGGDAFLAIDRNGNGKIDSGKELFGDQNGAKNGFEELRKLDTNGDGRINAADREFDRLLLWKDNGNGVTEPGELITLKEAGVKEIDLGYRNVNEVVAGGNRVAQVSSFVRNDGTRGKVADAILNYLV